MNYTLEKYLKTKANNEKKVEYNVVLMSKVNLPQN